MAIIVDSFLQMSVDDIIDGKHDFGPQLKSTDVLTGTPTLTDIDATGTITISNVAKNSAPYTDEDTGETVAANEAVEYRLEPSAAGTYNLLMVTSTVAGEKYNRKFVVDVI